MHLKFQSFRSAEENFISQSAISQQIQSLERALGFKLLERKNRSFTLTPAGQYFYQKSLILMADYERLCSEAAKIAKGDQRRAFSDEYANLLLTTCHSYIEVSTHSPLAQMERISPAELKNTPCILVASKTQQETEQAYYHDVIGFHGQFLYADTLEEARLMVIGRKGFLPVEGTGQMTSAETSIVRIPLVRREEPILRNYCAFWKKENSGYYVEEFAKLLKAQFEK